MRAMVAVALVLFAFDVVIFLFVNGNGQVFGLSPLWSIVLALFVGTGVVGTGSAVTVMNHRCWPLPALGVALNILMFIPLLLP